MTSNTPLSAVDEITQAFAGHYWDTLEPNKDIVLAHISAVLDTLRTRIASLEASGEVASILPTEKQMNQAFYVDVCRAEDRLKEFISGARALLDSLPQHWHGEAENELRSLCDETDAVLNPHMHPAKFVEIASKRFGAKSVVPQPAVSVPEELMQLHAAVEALTSDTPSGAASSARIAFHTGCISFVRQLVGQQGARGS